MWNIIRNSFHESLRNKQKGISHLFSANIKERIINKNNKKANSDSTPEEQEIKSDWKNGSPI